MVNIAVMAMLTFIAALILTMLGLSPGALAANGQLAGMLALAGITGMSGAIISLFSSKWIVKTRMRCRTIDGSEGEAEQWLVSTVEDLARRAGIKTPEVAIYPGEANAFATGASRNKALVAVSTGIIPI